MNEARTATSTRQRDNHNRLLKGCVMVICLTFCHGLCAQDMPRTLYVLNGLGRTLSKINLETGIITNDILVVGDVPSRLAADTDKIYVVNSLPPEVVIIDGRTDSIEKRIPLPEGSNPWDMALCGGHQAYVTNLMASTVSVMNVASGVVTGTIAVGEGPQGILTVDGSAYVANTGGWPDYQPSTVSVIDLVSSQVLKTLTVGTNPQELALDPDGRIHVLCSGRWGENEGRVYIIDPDGDLDRTPLVVDSLSLGGFPGDMAITAGGMGYATDWGDMDSGFLYSYNAFSGEVHHDSSNPLPVGKGAMRLLWDGKGGCLYVSNFDDDTVQRLDPATGSVTATYDFGDGAQDMVILDPLKVPFKGDVNSDGGIDAIDVVASIHFLLDMRVPTSEEFLRADCSGEECTGDSHLNVIDVMVIVNMILGMAECS